MASRTATGFWLGSHTVRSSPSGMARQPFGSIGTPARRWLTMRPSTTVSAPSSGSSSAPMAVSNTMLLPWASNSTGASSASAASMSVTAGRGS